MTARHDKATCEAAGGTGCGCGYEPYDTGSITVRRYFCEQDVPPDKATEGRTEAAAVDQAIATVRAALLAHSTKARQTPLESPALVALRVLADAVEELRAEANQYRIEADHGHDDYEDAEDVIRQIAEARPNKQFDPWARDICRDFIERPAPDRRERDTERVRLARQVADLEAALDGLLQSGGWGHSHWDSTGQHGAGCPTCIQQRDAKERARAALAAARSRDPQEPQT